MDTMHMKCSDAIAFFVSSNLLDVSRHGIGIRHSISPVGPLSLMFLGVLSYLCPFRFKIQFLRYILFAQSILSPSTVSRRCDVLLALYYYVHNRP